MANKLIDGPSKAAAYKSDLKQFLLKDYTKLDINKLKPEWKCTMFYFDKRTETFEELGVDQRGGDVSKHSCDNIAVARAMAYLLVDRRENAATFRGDRQMFYLKNLKASNISKPEKNPACTMFFLKN